MDCAFCRATPVAVCPVCSPVTMTPRAIRRKRSVSPHQVRIAQNETKIRNLTSALEARQNAKPAPAPVPKVAAPIFTPRPAQKARPAVVTPIGDTDWHAAARFTLQVLRKPLQLVDSVARQVDAVDERTQVGLMPGNWIELARAVEAGHLSHSQAVEVAQGWKVSA